MGFKANPQQALAMLSIVFGTTDDEKRPKMGKFLKKPDRKGLEVAKLIELHKVGRAYRVTLTDAGWMWAAENLDSGLPAKNRAARVLEHVLRRLDAQLENAGMTLQGFLATPAANDQTRYGVESPSHALPQSSASVSISERIERAAIEIGLGRRATRVRLKDLRTRLQDVPRDVLDRELVKLQHTGVLVLSPIDDPTDISGEDRSAALSVAGAARHILYLQGNRA